jgi:hypothetical protein
VGGTYDNFPFGFFVMILRFRSLIFFFAFFIMLPSDSLPITVADYCKSSALPSNCLCG